jgi:peptidoglycan L-alanyl-D-glutamate endopeptidase CwlK
MTFILGAKSRANLSGVHPNLASIVERAIRYTSVDFGVHEGVRTLERQKAYVLSGASRTLNSKHLVQPDGYGHAVDLVPYIDGQLRWEWPAIYPIAWAVRKAAIELETELIWGGVWDRMMSELGETPETIKRDVGEYAKRHPGPDFLDGPHYQLIFI